MKKAFLTLAIAAVCLVTTTDTLHAETLDEMYPGVWNEDAPVSISKALVKNNVRDCGEYHYKPSAKNSNEYLLYCTRDGKNWKAYLVWDLIGKVMGPYPPDPTVTSPY